ncbi:hypothetical protein K1719_033470 [Acacia pycnantha]|nr:hypothetical protein K1719_033470 [Acacia pycnantha]
MTSPINSPLHALHSSHQLPSNFEILESLERRRSPEEEAAKLWDIPDYILTYCRTVFRQKYCFPSTKLLI